MSLTDNILRHLLKVSSEPDLAGTHYELVGVLGRGAMGVVYAVHDTQLQRNVALKVLHSGGLIVGAVPNDIDAEFLRGRTHAGMDRNKEEVRGSFGHDANDAA